MVSDFLFELGCEELPSASVLPLAQALADGMRAGLEKAKIEHGEIRFFATPRRLALWIAGLAKEQPPQSTQRRGPALAAAYNEEGKPSQALIGFAKSCGVGIDELTELKTDKGAWLVYEATTEGAKTATLLPEMVKQVLAALPIAKPMRWGSGDIEFARPVHWALMLFGSDLIETEILGVTTSRCSYGHRFHHPQAIEIENAKSYETLLEQGHVVADFNKRRSMICQLINELASEHKAQAVMPDDLLDEVTSIVEWPNVLIANFEADFLEVPPEALIASMQAHQKCFALQNSRGELEPHFITVANINSARPEQVIAGNEKVMRARLSDAAFFFNQDKKQPLSSHIDATAKVIFQIKLGSLQDKANRIRSLMNYLAPILQLNHSDALRAAELSKCDLMTGMVGEFPELQGLMGYYYARHDGESIAVAQALNEQYMPRFASDGLPESNLGMALSLAERIDTLVGIFAIGQKPSGVKDPFKLRRHALAVVRMLVSNPVELNLSELIEQMQMIYGDLLPKDQSFISEIQPFILERLQSWYQGQGFSSDLVHAVRVRQENWLFDFDRRIHALDAFVKMPEAAALSAACKRVNNLLQHANLSATNDLLIDEAKLIEHAEKELFKQLTAKESEIKSSLNQGNYTQILKELAGLREPVDAFFEQVMVMVDDESLKMNRLALLQRLQVLLQGVADISLLQQNS